MISQPSLQNTHLHLKHCLSILATQTTSFQSASCICQRKIQLECQLEISFPFRVTALDAGALVGNITLAVVSSEQCTAVAADKYKTTCPLLSNGLRLLVTYHFQNKMLVKSKRVTKQVMMAS